MRAGSLKCPSPSAFPKALEITRALRMKSQQFRETLEGVLQYTRQPLLHFKDKLLEPVPRQLVQECSAAAWFATGDTI